MNFSFSKIPIRIALAGNLILFVVVLIGIGAIGASALRTAIEKAYQAIDEGDRQLQQVAVIHEAFEIQILEWKNLLLRGHDESIFYEHLSRFYESERGTIAAVQDLAKGVSKSDPVWPIMEDFQRTHKHLGQKYREAIRAYNDSDNDPQFVADELVVGLENEPRLLLDEIGSVLTKQRRNTGTEVSEALGFAQGMGAAGALLLTLIAVLFLFWIFDFHLVRPLGRAIAVAERISIGELDGHFAIDRKDEIGNLLTALKVMQESLVAARAEQTRLTQDLEQAVSERTAELRQEISERKIVDEQLVHAQRMDAIGQLTAGVAHDFNNMLAVILGNAELLGDRLDEDDPQLAAVFRGARSAAEMTQRLLAFSRKQVLKPEIIDANKLIADTTGLLRRTLEEHIDIETVVAAGLWNCEVDPAQLENAMVNLAINARDAMPDGGKLTIEAANARLDDDYAATLDGVKPGEYVMLTVTDTGCGMPPDIREHALEPFFTTKEVGEGSGLGLSTVYGFAKQSGGDLVISSEEGQGTTIKLYLPRVGDLGVQNDSRPEAKSPSGYGETILVIEDEPDVLALADALLTTLGYRVLTAKDGQDGLDVVKREPNIDLLLSDVVLPGGVSGPDFAEEAKRHISGLKILFMSGYAEGLVHDQGPLPEGVDLLKKPFPRRELAQRIRAALDS